MAYKWKLSLGNLRDIWPKYGHLSNLAEIMEFSSFDVARQHRKPQAGQAFSCLLDSQGLYSINTINITFQNTYTLFIDLGQHIFSPHPEQMYNFQ